MKRGWSGDEVTLHKTIAYKRGSARVLEQGDYMQVLGSVVCPVVYEIGDRYSQHYEMELLRPAGQLKSEDIAEVRRLLEKYVWSREAVAHDDEWMRHLVNWVADEAGPVIAQDVAKKLYSLYGSALTRLYERRCLIHGDPTLANVMLDDKKRILLVDPTPPGGKIPSFREVDVGKMLQSAIGWEAATMGWDHAPGLVATVLEGESDLAIRRAWFWCFIHILRLIPYVKYDANVLAWAHQKKEELHHSVVRI